MREREPENLQDKIRRLKSELEGIVTKADQEGWSEALDSAYDMKLEEVEQAQSKATKI